MLLEREYVIVVEVVPVAYLTLNTDKTWTARFPEAPYTACIKRQSYDQVVGTNSEYAASFSTQTRAEEHARKVRQNAGNFDVHQQGCIVYYADVPNVPYLLVKDSIRVLSRCVSLSECLPVG